MKKLMMMSVTCLAYALFAVPVENLETIGAVELAPSGEITQAAMTFGKMVGNQLVATMLVNSWQSGLVKSYGRSRADAPVFWLLYADVKALEAAANGKPPQEVKDPIDAVLVYPMADGPAQLMLKHVGSTKNDDGTIHLLPGGGRANDAWVKYVDGDAFCVFANSPAMAMRAAKDSVRLIADRKAQVAQGHTPLVRIQLNERGIVAAAWAGELAEAAKAGKQNAGSAAVEKTLEQLQRQERERRLAMLRGYRSVVGLLDLDATGLVLSADAQVKPGAKPLPFAGFKLPAGAFDVVQTDSPLFGAGCVGLQGMSGDADEQRAALNAISALVLDGARQLKQEADAKKYTKLIDEIADAIQEFLRTVPVPEPKDWSAGALAFDAALHPFVFCRSESKQAAVSAAAVTKLLDRLCAACTRQWPKQHFLARTGATGWTLDLAELVDVAVAEEGKVQDAKDQKELAEMKANVSKALGDSKLLVRFSKDGRKGFVGAPNVKPIQNAGKATGETRIAAALPETAKKRPTGAFCLTPYAFVRDTLLPILARFAEKKDLAQLNAMRSAMPVPKKNGALAGAVWVEADGSARAVLRVTADEIRNLGEAFNAFTAAQLSAAAADEDE